MKKFSIQIIDQEIKRLYGIPCCIGEIVIDTYKERFEMPLEYWSMEKYELQWKQGIDRIKNHNKSCLVTEIQNPKLSPWVVMWVLYKEDEKIFIQNKLLQGEHFMLMLKKEPFDLETCYDFIMPRETVSDEGMSISEWNVGFIDILCSVGKPQSS